MGPQLARVLSKKNIATPFDRFSIVKSMRIGDLSFIWYVLRIHYREVLVTSMLD